MLSRNFKCIFLGCDANEAGTFFIHLEYINKVPYRKDIIINKKILYRGKDKIIKVNYSNRPKKIEFDFNKAFNKIKKLGGRINKAELKFGFSYSLKLKDFLINLDNSVVLLINFIFLAEIIFLAILLEFLSSPNLYIIFARSSSE